MQNATTIGNFCSSLKKNRERERERERERGEEN